MTRMRKACISDPVTGELVPFPHTSRVAELPTGRRNFSSAKRGKHLLGVSLDRAAEILIWSLADLDELQQSLWMQVRRVVFMIGVKAMLDGTLEREIAR
jgi:hypothetical protein